MQSNITTTSDIDQLQLRSDNLIGVGVFAHVYRLDKGRVRKLPGPDSCYLARQSIRNEGRIYDHLGDHPRVVKLLKKGDQFIDLEYAPYGHIESYLKMHPNTSNDCRIRLAREAIEAVVFIHSKGIIHADLAARQFLLDSKLEVKICDFGFSSLGDDDVLGFENSSHQLPRDLDAAKSSTVQSDIFALGSTLYEILVGKRPYEGMLDNDITALYESRKYPDVKGILYGDVIMGCWKGHFKSAKGVLDIFS